MINDKLLLIELAKLDGMQWATRAVGLDLFATNLQYPPEGVEFVKEIRSYSDARLATQKEIDKSIERGQFTTLIPDYLNSHQNILRLIKKCKLKGLCADSYWFGECLLNELGLGLPYRSIPVDIFYLTEKVIEATTRQLCITLLKATGKFKS